MSERTPPSTTYADRDVLSFLWQALASRTMAAVLLALLAVVVLLALLFSPQRPGPSADVNVLARWTNDAQERFARWYDALLALGVFDMGTAVWLRGLLAWSALALMVRLANSVAQVTKAWRRPDVRQTESFFKGASGFIEWQVAQERTALVEALAQRLAWPAWLPWRRLQIRPYQEETSQASYLHQDWLTWRRVGVLLVHLGLMLILAGVALNARLGWRQEGATLMPGQVIRFGRPSDFSLRLESVERLGTVGQATSRITLDGLAGKSQKGRVAVGRPYTSHGVTVYQRDFGPILRVSARDAGGSAPGGRMRSPIPLADASMVRDPADEVRLAFTESQAEQYLLMPDIRKVVRLVLYRQGETWDTRHDELQLEVYAGDLDTPEARGSIIGDGQVELNGIVYQFAWEQYAVLDIVCSSYQWLVRMSTGLALLSLLVALLIPPARLWVRVVEDKGTSVVGLAGEMPGGTEALAGWRRRLGGDDADG